MKKQHSKNAKTERKNYSPSYRQGVFLVTTGSRLFLLIAFTAWTHIQELQPSREGVSKVRERSERVKRVSKVSERASVYSELVSAADIALGSWWTE